MEHTDTIQPTETVRLLLESDNRIELTFFLESLSSHELIHLMSRLNKKEQQKLFTILNPEDAAIVMEELPEVQAVDIIEDMDSGNAAAIINEMMSDERADLIMELHDKDAEAILTEMNPAEAASVRKLIEYGYDTAGGLMITEYFNYKETLTVRQVVDDLKKNAEKYKYYHVRYIYVVSRKGVFLGVLQMQDLLMAEPGQTIIRNRH